MKLFRKPLETVEIPTIKPPMFKFRKYDDFLFERILYIREVLANPDRFIDAPDEDALNNELFKLIRDYQNIVSKKVNLDEKED